MWGGEAAQLGAAPGARGRRNCRRRRGANAQWLSARARALGGPWSEESSDDGSRSTIMRFGGGLLSTAGISGSWRRAAAASS
eukprot:7889110-Pyramimonas_sp.AAC.1